MENSAYKALIFGITMIIVLNILVFIFIFIIETNADIKVENEASCPCPTLDKEIIEEEQAPPIEMIEVKYKPLDVMVI